MEAAQPLWLPWHCSGVDLPWQWCGKEHVWVMQAWNCFLNCFDPGLFGDHKAKGWASSGGAILLWLMKKTSKWRSKRKEVKLDKRLGPKSKKRFLYFSLLYSKQDFDFFNLTLANFKQNEFSSSLVPFCLASLSLHTCWSLAEQSRTEQAPLPLLPWVPALAAWVAAAVCPFALHSWALTEHHTMSWAAT